MKHRINFSNYLNSSLPRPLSLLCFILGYTIYLFIFIYLFIHLFICSSVYLIPGQHEAIKSEIEAREESFRTIVETGEALAQGGHAQAQDIQERLDKLLNERQLLHSAWQHKKVHLDQLIDLHFFLRDAKQLETMSASQEVSTPLNHLVMGLEGAGVIRSIA
jgi:hypothetical protein